MSAHVHNHSAERKALARKVQRLQRDTDAAGSTEDRFRELLGHGLEALDMDSYGIAAAYVIRSDRLEVSFVGRNTVAQGDPRGHAEMNAIGSAADLLKQTDSDRRASLARLAHEGSVQVRQCPEAAPESILYSTLEPCPMCTVAAINAGVDKVIFAHEDPEAGALAPARLERLAPLWARTVSHLRMRVVQCQSDDPEDAESYLPPDVSSVLEQLFEVTRVRLDQQLSTSSFFRPRALTEALAAWRADWESIRAREDVDWSTLWTQAPRPSRTSRTRRNST
jgi:tRNA(Arg) A34 adenosine deaminase TadA